MNQQQLQRMTTGSGFIAALDQSGGSTPKALEDYGINEDAYDGEAAMFDLVHQMRTRIISSQAFSSERILGAILFKETMERQVKGVDTADYLWEQKGIVPFLKIDSGLADETNGVQLLKDMPQLDELLARANEKNIFGTKMRSVINALDTTGIADIVEQQFAVAKQILAAGLVPIIEPEVNIHADEKTQIEQALLARLHEHLSTLDEDQKVIFKLTLPDKDNFYTSLMDDPRTVRVVALSGGYSRDEANAKLARNNNLIASFSRALASGLSVDQSDQEFEATLDTAIQSIFEASQT